MAMFIISKAASVRRANPVSTYPSTMSITPLMSGTPGTRYSTLVANAISEVVLNINAVDAHSEETKADTMNMI
mgnify:CR=1 FL=1